MEMKTDYMMLAVLALVAVFSFSALEAPAELGYSPCDGEPVTWDVKQYVNNEGELVDVRMPHIEHYKCG